MASGLFSKISIIALTLALFGASLPTPALAGSPAEISPIQEHTIKFYLDPALVSDADFVKAALTKYVADMNLILAKNTNRRLVFDPAIGLILTTVKPQTDSSRPPMPTTGFEIWAHAAHTDQQNSYGGYAGMDLSGAGVLAGLKWTQVYDPDALSGSAIHDYSVQLNNMLHELAHVFGAGIGEYYNLASITDTTATEPLLNINLNNPDDSYWSDKPDFMVDPLLRLTSPASRADYLNTVRYSNLTAAVVSGAYRNSLSSFDHFTVQVLDETGQPAADVNVKVWNVQGASGNPNELLFDEWTDANGQVTLAWGGNGPAHSSANFLRLIKVYRDNQPFAEPKYVSIFDVDAAQLVAQTAAYTVTLQAEPPAPQTVTFLSGAAQDGFVLENSENGNAGGSINSGAATFRLGDDAKNRQYKSIISFDTASLPDDAIITSVTLKIKQSGAPTGKNPFTVLGGLLVDVRAGAFGNAKPLALNDFNAAASVLKVGTFNTVAEAGWYSVNLNADGIAHINLTNVTQLRLRFAKDDNNNQRADFMNFASGNSASDQPQLVIVYELP
jgi:hypothetical protein